MFVLDVMTQIWQIWWRPSISLQKRRGSLGPTTCPDQDVARVPLGPLIDPVDSLVRLWRNEVMFSLNELLYISHRLGVMLPFELFAKLFQVC